MNNQKLVSIIVPVYNVEKYLPKTITSLLQQKYSNIEIILVNDGSPDACNRIIEEYKNKDSRVVAIHKENGGVSSARNAGLDVCRGEYIMFVDGDDWVEANYVESFVNLIDSGNYDMAVSDVHFVGDKKILKDDNETLILSSEDVLEQIYMNKLYMAVWNKIYNRHFIETNQIRFDTNIWYGEGMLFNIVCLSKTHFVPYSHHCVYHYVNNPRSAMRSFSLDSELCGIRSIELQKNHINMENPRIRRAIDYHLYLMHFTIICRLVENGVLIQYIIQFIKSSMYLKKHFYVPVIANISPKNKVYFLCVAFAPFIMAKRQQSL